MIQTLALLSLTLLSSHQPRTCTSAFTLASTPQRLQRNLPLGATVEKPVLISPDSLPADDDDIPALFEDYVQKTYG